MQRSPFLTNHLHWGEFHAWQRLLILFALSLVAGFTRLVGLTEPSLWLDELGSWALVDTAPLSELLGLLLDPQAGYPLYHVILWIWIALVGDSALALRLPSALAGIAAVVCIGLWAQAMGRSLWLALILSVCAPFLLLYAHEATVYSFFILWGVLWWWALWSYQHDMSRTGWCLLLLALVGLLLHRAAVAILISSALSTLISSPRPSKQQYLLLFGGLILLIVASLTALLTGVIETASIDAGQVRPDQVLLHTLWAFIFGQTSTQAWVLLLPSLGLFIWGCYRTMREGGVLRGLLIAFVFSLLLMAGQTLLTGRFEPRYLAPLYPLWLLLLVPPAALPPRSSRLVQSAVGSVLIVQLVTLLQPGGLWGATPVREQYREAMTQLLQTLHPDDRLLIFPPSLELVWRYYAPRIAPQTPHLPVVVADDLPPAWPGQREFLLVAPFHADATQRAIPKMPSLDNPPGTLPCGEQSFHGVSIKCRVIAFNYEPLPRSTIAIFGQQLILRDLTLVPTANQQFPGGSLALYFAWERMYAPQDSEQFIFQLTRVGAHEPVWTRYGVGLGGLLPEQWPLARQRMSDRINLPLRDALGHTLKPGHYRLNLRVEVSGEPLPVSGPSLNSSHELQLATFEIGSPTSLICLAGQPDSCGQVQMAGTKLYDYGGPWLAQGVQFFLPPHGINERTFWDERYQAALDDGSLELWLDRAALRLHPNLLRIFIELPRRENGGVTTPTSHETVHDFAERAAARGMRLGLVLNNSANWEMTLERRKWIEGLLRYFMVRGTLDRIAYLNADNEINNHCYLEDNSDCFALDANYRNGAVAWAHKFYNVVKGRAPQMLVTVGMSTELEAPLNQGGVANYFLPDSMGRTLISALDFLSPHNYGGRADVILSDIRQRGFDGPVVLEEYGFPTDPAPRHPYWTEGPVTCQRTPFSDECLDTAPYFVELNLQALRTYDYAGGVAWMLVDTTEKELPDACNHPILTFDHWTGLLAVGSAYCEGGTRTRQEGATKATGLRVCAYHTGSLDLCLADAIQREVP